MSCRSPPAPPPRRSTRRLRSIGSSTASPVSLTPLRLCRSPYPGQIACKRPVKDPAIPYLSAVAERLEDLLGGDLVGVYVGGSYALGNYLPGRSDLDVAAVVRAALPPVLKPRI